MATKFGLEEPLKQLKWKWAYQGNVYNETCPGKKGKWEETFTHTHTHIIMMKLLDTNLDSHMLCLNYL